MRPDGIDVDTICSSMDELTNLNMTTKSVLKREKKRFCTSKAQLRKCNQQIVLTLPSDMLIVKYISSTVEDINLCTQFDNAWMTNSKGIRPKNHTGYFVAFKFFRYSSKSNSTYACKNV
jgi:hypothetical protein